MNNDLCTLKSGPYPAVIAARNEITDEYKTMILKFCPVMRSKEFGLHDAAAYLESWVCGTMPLAPLMDCNASLDFCWHTIYVFLSHPCGFPSKLPFSLDLTF